MLEAELVRGGRYNWKGQADRLVYLRRFNGWHQFRRIGDKRDVWCEVLTEDLHMLEPTAEAALALACPYCDDQDVTTVHDGDGAYHMVCEGCGSESPQYDSEQRALAWIGGSSGNA